MDTDENDNLIRIMLHSQEHNRWCHSQTFHCSNEIFSHLNVVLITLLSVRHKIEADGREILMSISIIHSNSHLYLICN